MCACDKEQRQWSVTLCRKDNWRGGKKPHCNWKPFKNIEHVAVFSIQRCCAVQVESECRCPFSLCPEAACHLDSHAIKIWKHFWSEMNSAHKLHLTLSCKKTQNKNTPPPLIYVHIALVLGLDFVSTCCPQMSCNSRENCSPCKINVRSTQKGSLIDFS